MGKNSKLIPVLRDGVDVIQMVFYKRLKEYLGPKYESKGAAYINQICGAVVNELFGVENMAAPYSDFLKNNKMEIQTEIDLIASQLEDMRIPLTDALRIQFLCDSLEGVDSELMLKRAEGCGILIVERQIPLPKNFMSLVRKLGEKFNILQHAGISQQRQGATEDEKTN